MQDYLNSVGKIRVNSYSSLFYQILSINWKILKNYFFGQKPVFRKKNLFERRIGKFFRKIRIRLNILPPRIRLNILLARIRNRLKILQARIRIRLKILLARIRLQLKSKKLLTLKP